MQGSGLPNNSCITGHSFPSAMVHDRDGIFGHWLPGELAKFGCESFKTPPRSPWETPFVNRLNLSIKTEILNRSMLIDNHHVRNLCVGYQEFYNRKRPHQGISGVIPDSPDIGCENKPNIKNMRVKKTLELNGLVTHFKLAA